MQELQEKAKVFVENNGMHMSIEASMIDLSSEVGDLSKQILLLSQMGATDPQNIQITRELILEFGDVLFSLSNLANIMGIDLEKAFEFAMENYEKRVSEGELQ